MSRFRNAARSLTSGYAAMIGNALYTLASYPLALHYLSTDQFGLWALITQIAGYLVLIDLGMSGSVARILIDHKDNQERGDYGSVIKTGSLVLVVQGAIIILAGVALAYALPAVMQLPVKFVPIFRVLTAGQCALLGAFFIGRMLTSLLQAHQRFDVINYAQIVQLAAGFAAQWLTFH